MKSVYSDSYYTVYQLANTKPYFQVINGNCNLVSSNSSRDTLTTKCSEQSTLIRRELYAPGWTASINGKTTLVSKSGLLFQQIELPKGRSSVKFNYTPQHITLAYIAFGLGAVLIIYSGIRKQTNKTSK